MDAPFDVLEILRHAADQFEAAENHTREYRETQSPPLATLAARMSSSAANMVVKARKAYELSRGVL
jgi:hypothetical protein